MLVPDSHRDRANAIGQMTGPAAGVVAPALAGMLYALVGVAGSIAIDIATFIAAIAVLAVVRIPRPAETAEGLAMRTSVWRQTFDGFRYLAARPALLGFCGYASGVNFVANTAMVLLTPYVLARTGKRAAVRRGVRRDERRRHRRRARRRRRRPDRIAHADGDAGHRHRRALHRPGRRRSDCAGARRESWP